MTREEQVTQLAYEAARWRTQERARTEIKITALEQLIGQTFGSVARTAMLERGIIFLPTTATDPGHFALWNLEGPGAILVFLNREVFL